MTTTTPSNVRVRFAPSPTGHLHIGGARSAIFNWLFARHCGGMYLVRVEDTDVARSTKEYLTSIVRSLEWLRLESDQPLVFQMERVEVYRKAARQLMEQGLAYPCFCAPRGAEEVISDLDHGHGSKYDGTCRDKPYTQQDLAQKPYAIRFRVPENQPAVTFNDLVLGSVSVEPDQFDDYIIMRRDGTPIYNFCVVVDDIFMKITHVVRGQDHVSNTPKHILLYQAFGVQPPQFAHIPLILGPSGAKLSKRDAAVSVEEYRMQGYMADALFNYLVRLGWAHGDQEVFTRQELIDLFTLEHVGKKGAVFDIKKLQWLNGVYMRAASPESLLEQLQAISPAYVHELHTHWNDEQLTRLINEYKQRAVTLLELHRGIATLAHNPAELDVQLIKKWYSAATATLLQAFADELATLDDVQHDALVAIAQRLTAAAGLKLVDIAQPLRLALTGGVVSPGIFELIAVLGKERSCARIRKLIEVLAQHNT